MSIPCNKRTTSSWRLSRPSCCTTCSSSFVDITPLPSASRRSNTCHCRFLLFFAAKTEDQDNDSANVLQTKLGTKQERNRQKQKTRNKNNSVFGKGKKKKKKRHTNTHKKTNKTCPWSITPPSVYTHHFSLVLLRFGWAPPAKQIRQIYDGVSCLLTSRRWPISTSVSCCAITFSATFLSLLMPTNLRSRWLIRCMLTYYSYMSQNR